MAKPKKVVKQKQKQTQIVNINLGTKAKKKGKRKVSRAGAKPRKETQIIPAFNPPSIINYPPQFVAPNNPNWFKPPSVSQSNKEYAVLPEGETAGLLNLNPANSIPLKIGRGEERVNLPIREPNLVDLAKPVGEGSIAPSFEEDDISVLTEAPEFQNLPVEAEGQVLDLPPAEASSLLENKEPLFNPFNLAVPVTSGRSLAESVAEPLSLSGFSHPYSETGLSLPQSRFLGTLPPIKTAEKSEVPFSPLAPSGLTLPPPLPPKKAKPFLTEEPPVIKEKKKGRPKGATNKPKAEEPKTNLLSIFPTTANVEPFGIPIQLGQKEEEPFKYSPPLSQLEGQYQFIGGPTPPTEKEVNPLERRRGGGVLTGAEEALIGGTPAFLAQPTFIA